MTTNICFLFAVYQEFDLATRLLDQIKQFYPTADVVCVTDGTHDPVFESICELRRAEYIKGEQRKLRQLGGSWIERLYQAAIDNSSADLIVQLDPDSFILRQFNYFPNADVSGSIVVGNNGYSFLQGGCKLYKRETLRKILESGLLQDTEYAVNSKYYYQRYMPPYLMPGETPSLQLVATEDHILTNIFTRLNLQVEEWSDVYCRVREACPDPERYAVIHPVKQLCI